MSGYLIYHYNIIKREGIEALGPRATALLAELNGELMIASTTTALEGSPYSHMVVYRFASVDVAKAFYASKESQALAILRHQHTEGTAMIVSGFEQ